MYQTETVTSCLKNNLLDTLIGSKMGTLIPNRIFVGGLPSNTTENELRDFFAQFGQVKDIKIIVDRMGLSKGTYGFVTFESQDVAQKLITNESDTLVFQDRKLNISFAIKKNQVIPRPDPSTAALLLGSGTGTFSQSYPMAFGLLPYTPVSTANQSVQGPVNSSAVLTAQQLASSLGNVNNANTVPVNPVDAYLTAASLLMPNSPAAFYLSNGINSLMSPSQINAIQLAQQTVALQNQQNLPPPNAQNQASQPVFQNTGLLSTIQTTSPNVNAFYQEGLNTTQPANQVPNFVMASSGQPNQQEYFANVSAGQFYGTNQPLVATGVGMEPQQKVMEPKMVFMPNNLLRSTKNTMYLNGALTSTPMQNPMLKNKLYSTTGSDYESMSGELSTCGSDYMSTFSVSNSQSPPHQVSMADYILVTSNQQIKPVAN